MHENDDSQYRHIEVHGEDGIITSVFTGLGLNKTVYVRIVIHPIGEGQPLFRFFPPADLVIVERGVDVVPCVAHGDELVQRRLIDSCLQVDEWLEFYRDIV